MRAVLHPGFPGHRHRKQHRLERKGIEHREDAVLVEQREACRQHEPGEQMRHVIGMVHLSTSIDRKASNIAMKASTNAPPKNSLTRNTRIFAMLTSQMPSTAAARDTLAK